MPIGAYLDMFFPLRIQLQYLSLTKLLYFPQRQITVLQNKFQRQRQIGQRILPIIAKRCSPRRGWPFTAGVCASSEEAAE